MTERAPLWGKVVRGSLHTLAGISIGTGALALLSNIGNPNAWEAIVTGIVFEGGYQTGTWKMRRG